jgi:putative ABC transport system substrate-binding protein
MPKQGSARRKTRIGWLWINSILIAGLLLSGCASAAPKVYRVGVLSGLSVFAPAFDGFKAKMTELGYVEGENILYDVQSTDVDIDAYKRITEKFVADGVDLIFSFPTEASMEAKAAAQGTNIPVVFALAFTDVEGINLVESVRQPGGNVTGVRFPSVDIATKRLQILLEIVPGAKQVFVPYLAGYPNVPGQLEAIRKQAKELGVELIEFGTASPDELQAELERRAALRYADIDAILMIAEPLTVTSPFFDILGKFSYDNKIPMGGALMTVDGYNSIFGLLPDPVQAGADAARLADKILKGTPAGTIPVLTSESYFQINYAAAQQLGVTIPEGLLRQADEIIR